MTTGVPTTATTATTTTSTTRSSWLWVVGVWAVVAGFAAVTVLRSVQVDLPFRDPYGRMFSGRLTSSVTWLAVLVLAQAVVRSLRARRSLRGVPEVLRAHWSRERILLVLSGLLAYHVVYACYRNLKSWNAFRTLRDQELTSFETWLFAGHTPAALLHDLFGQGTAALVLVVVYRSFTYLVPISVLASLLLVERVRDAYVFLMAAMWVWILGAGSYYLLPSLGPFAFTPGDFTRLPDTAITTAQAAYLTERAHILADPVAGDAFASLGAFASLHVAFTCMVLLMLRHYRAPGALQLFGLGYLLATMVATVYFGWHYVVDDVAGVAIAVASVALARAIVRPDRQEADDRA